MAIQLLPVAEPGAGSETLIDLSQAIARDVFAQTDTHHVRTVILVTADANLTEPIGRVDDPPAAAEVTTDTVEDAAVPVGGGVAQGIDNGVAQGQPAAPATQDTSPPQETPFLPTIAPTPAPQPRIGDDEDGDGEAAALGLAEIGATGTGTSDESRGVTMYDYYPSTEQLTKLIDAGFGLHFVPPTLGAGSELESFLQAILDAYPDLVGSVLFLDLPVVQADLTDLAARRELVARLWQTLAGRAGVLAGELDVRSAAALLGVTIIDSDATVLAPDASRAGPAVGGDGRYVVQVRPEGKPAAHFHAASRSGSRQTQDDQTLQALLTAMGPTLPVIEKLRSVLATLRAEALWDATVNTNLRDVLARAELGHQARVELGAQAQRTLAAVELATIMIGGAHSEAVRTAQVETAWDESLRMKALIKAAGPAPRADAKHTVKPQPAPTPTPEAATAPSTPQQTSNDQPPQGHRSDGVRSDPVPNVASIRPRAEVVELRRAVAKVTNQVTALGLAHDRALQANKASGANKARGRIRNWKSIGRDWSTLTSRLRALTEAVNNAGPQVSAARVRAVMDQADLVKGLADSVQRALAEAGYPVALAPPTTARSRPRVVEVAGDITTVDVGHNPDPDAPSAQPRRGGIVIPVGSPDGVLTGVGNGSVGGISVAAGRVIDAIHPVGVPTGVAVAGEATGATSVSHVIYVNPPVLNQHEDPAGALYAAYQNALLLADAHRLDTVAIQLLPMAQPGARSETLVDLSRDIARQVLAHTDTHHVRTVILVTPDASITEPIGRVDNPPVAAEVTADAVEDAEVLVPAQRIDSGAYVPGTDVGGDVVAGQALTSHLGYFTIAVHGRDDGRVQWGSAELSVDKFVSLVPSLPGWDEAVRANGGKAPDLVLVMCGAGAVSSAGMVSLQEALFQRFEATVVAAAGEVHQVGGSSASAGLITAVGGWTVRDRGGRSKPQHESLSAFIGSLAKPAGIPAIAITPPQDELTFVQTWADDDDLVITTVPDVPAVDQPVQAEPFMMPPLTQAQRARVALLQTVDGGGRDERGARRLVQDGLTVAICNYLAMRHRDGLFGLARTVGVHHQYGWLARLSVAGLRRARLHEVRRLRSVMWVARQIHAVMPGRVVSLPELISIRQLMDAVQSLREPVPSTGRLPEAASVEDLRGVIAGVAGGGWASGVG